MARILAGIYLVLASALLIWDGMQPPAGGWISLKNMGAFLVTFPASAPLSMIGLEPDLGNPVIKALMVLLTTGMIYGFCRLFTAR